MSVILEAVVFSGEGSQLAGATERFKGRLELSSSRLPSSLGIVYRSGPRSDAAFTELMDELAAELSKRAGRALIVRYDSRIGHRSSALFESGAFVRAFGEADELFVPLNERGYPVSAVEPLKADQLDPDVEYETSTNAVEMGLELLGKGNWGELRQFAGSQ